MTWTDLQQGYLETLPDTSLRQAVITWLPRLLAFCAERGLLSPAELSPRDLEDYQQSLLWQPGPKGRLYAANTVYLAVRLARQFMRWAAQAARLPRDPTQGLVLRRPSANAPRLLTARELQAVLEAPDRTRPLGLRDALYMELLTAFELSSQRCLALDLADAPRLTPTGCLQAYLRQGRPQLAQDPRETALLLTRSGKRMGAVLGGVIPVQCGRAAGLEERVCARQLAQSYRVHHQAGARSPLSL